MPAPEEDKLAAELEAQLSDVDRRQADRIADRITREWRERYGDITPAEHEQHHLWLRRCAEYRATARRLLWDAAIKPAVALVVVVLLAWIGNALLRAVGVTLINGGSP